MEILSGKSFLVLLVILLWILPWKVAAMWTASKRSDEKWFVFLLILFIFPFGLFAILDIFYLFGIAKKSWREIRNIFNTKVEI